MTPRTDKDRLRDGERAIQVISGPEPTTLDGLVAQLDIVMTGAIALQSTDDLGSPEANDAAWKNMLHLQERADDLRKKIARLAKKPK